MNKIRILTLFFVAMSAVLIAGCATSKQASFNDVQIANAKTLGDVRKEEIKAKVQKEMVETQANAEVEAAKWNAIGAYFGMKAVEAENGNPVSKGTKVETDSEGRVKTVHVVEEDRFLETLFDGGSNQASHFAPEFLEVLKGREKEFSLPSPLYVKSKAEKYTDMILGGIGTGLGVALDRGADVAMMKISEDNQTERHLALMDYQKFNSQQQNETQRHLSDNQRLEEESQNNMIAGVVEDTSDTLQTVSNDNATTLQSVSEDLSRTNSNLAGVNGAVANTATQGANATAQALINNPPIHESSSSYSYEESKEFPVIIVGDDDEDDEETNNSNGG